MRWRPRQQEIEAGTWSSPCSYDPYQDRSPELAEVLARLESATRLRDADSVARLLDRLAQSDDGMWLLHQCAAAGLREVAARISEPAPGQPSSAPVPGIRTIGAA